MSYRHNIYKTAVETFEKTCFLFPVEDDEVDASDSKYKTTEIQTVVEFRGAAQGMVIITPSASLLHAMAANMLGIDHPDAKDKEEALSEVANIISGNVVPMFNHDDKICYINPPRIVENEYVGKNRFNKSEHESVRVLLNEGAAEIIVVYENDEGL